MKEHGYATDCSVLSEWTQFRLPAGIEIDGSVIQCGLMQINPEIFNFCNFTATDGGAGQTGYSEIRVAPAVYINKSEAVRSLSDLQSIELTRFEQDLLIQEIGGGDKVLPNGDMATNGIPINLSQVDGKLKFDWIPDKEISIDPQDFIDIMAKSAYPADYAPAPVVPTPIQTLAQQPAVENSVPKIEGVTDLVGVSNTLQIDSELQKRIVEQRIEAVKGTLPLIGLAGSIGLTLVVLGYLLKNWGKLKDTLVVAKHPVRDGQPDTQVEIAFSTPTKNHELGNILASPLPEAMQNAARLSELTAGNRMRNILAAAKGAPGSKN